MNMPRDRATGRRYITRPRLDATDYVGRRAYHLTIVASHREPRLIANLAPAVVGHLERTAVAMQFELLAYTIMPTHLHILAVGLTDDANAVRFVQHFKQASSYAARRHAGDRLWQPSFHDHVIRGEEDLRAIARYIFENPARSGLIESGSRWPFNGGTMLNGGDGDVAAEL